MLKKKKKKPKKSYIENYEENIESHFEYCLVWKNVYIYQSQYLHRMQNPEIFCILDFSKIMIVEQQQQKSVSQISISVKVTRQMEN